MSLPVARCTAETDKHDKKDAGNVTARADMVEEQASAEEERRLVRKLDRRILPITCLLYLFSGERSLFCFCFPARTRCSPPIREYVSHLPVLDRTNMGNARLLGLPEGILGGDKTGSQFDWLISGFYFAYVSCIFASDQCNIFIYACGITKITCQVPATISSKLFSPKKFITLAAVGWGVVSTLMVRIEGDIPMENSWLTADLCIVHWI